MLLMIDNYDSFTYNLVQYFFELGQKVEVYRNDQISLQEIEKKSPDFLVISPGPCTPKEAGISVNAISHFAGKMPILGVCLGHQALAQAYGAKVVRANELMHGKTSKVFHHWKGLFSGLSDSLVATRYHSLIADRATLPKSLEVTAWLKDGTIMGLHHKDFPNLYGVQFHPESVLTESGHHLLSNFLGLAES